MSRYFKKKFTGTGHVLGSGESENGEKSLLDRLEEDKKKKKAPAKVSLTEHLQTLESQRKNAPLQFCQETPEASEPIQDDGQVEEDRGEQLDVQISVLQSLEELNSETIPLMKRILRNLILHPSEKKYHKLNLSNAKVQEGLLKVEGAMEFLHRCGFETTAEQLLYQGPTTMKWPKFGLQRLNQHFPDPIKDPPQPKEEETAGPSSNNDMDTDIPRRDRRTQLVLLRPTEVVLPDWFFERTSAELKSEYFTMLKKREQDQTFMTEKQRKRMNGEAAVTYTFAVIRIRLPEGVLLQGEFDAKEPVSRIHEWVSEHLRDLSRTFDLFLPTRKKLGMKESVEKCQLMPASLLSFHWPDGNGITSPEPTVTDELLTTAIGDWKLPITDDS